MSKSPAPMLADMTDPENPQPIDGNPRAVMGGNMPPSMFTADELLPRLDAHYAGLWTDVTKLMSDLATDSPAIVQNEDDNGIVARLMERLRTTIKALEANHKNEKAPYLNSGRLIDQIFNGRIDRLSLKRDGLQKLGDDYTRRKIAAERMERERLARIEAEKAAEARAEAEKAERERQELEAAAARARKPENVERLEQAAEVRGGEAALAQVDQLVAESRAENAALATMASSADIARTRFESGHLATAGQTPFVQIEDETMLDMAALWPFFKEEEKLRALKAWAKVTGHKKPMTGAIVEMRDKAQYR